MSNVWESKQVKIKAGTRVRIWSIEDNAAESAVIPAEEAWRVHRVAKAMACPTMHGGGSDLEIIDPNFPEFVVWVHSSNVEEV